MTRHDIETLRDIEVGPDARILDLLIVGAGPAGMAAALVADEAGLAVLVADEGPAPGGQVFRNVLAADRALAGMLGADYLKGRAQAERFQASGAGYAPRTTVFMIEREAREFIVGLSSGDSSRMVSARHVLIATGALERPFPIPGWTLPGVMTAGAGQTLLKTSALVPQGPLVLAGNGPLLMLLAAQYLRAGVSITAVLETTPPANLWRTLPTLPGFLASPYPWKGLGLIRRVLSQTRVLTGVTALRAEGEARLQSVVFTRKGREASLPADVLLLHQGVVPQVNLAMSAGVDHVWNAQRLAFEPQLSDDLETNVPGLFIAGDSGGIGGAEVAETDGVLAALAITQRVSRERPGHAALLAQTQRRRQAARRGRDFLDALYRPARQFRQPDDAVIVCRCEEVSAGEIRALARRGAQGPNQVKAFSRAGMGPCQGRQCGLTSCEIMADTLDKTPAEIGHMRIRSPVKPITVRQMAGLTAQGVDSDEPGSPGA
jgi:thioredoxin reductase/bacterioferritin-associated ferredoxin